MNSAGLTTLDLPRKKNSCAALTVHVRSFPPAVSPHLSSTSPLTWRIQRTRPDPGAVTVPQPVVGQKERPGCSLEGGGEGPVAEDLAGGEVGTMTLSSHRSHTEWAQLYDLFLANVCPDTAYACPCMYAGRAEGPIQPSPITVHVSSGACVIVTDGGCCSDCCSPAYTTIRPFTMRRSPAGEWSG